VAENSDPIVLLSDYVQREQDPERLRDCFYSSWVVIESLLVRMDQSGARTHKRELVERVFDEELERQRDYLSSQADTDELDARFAEFLAVVEGAA
jgi:hypothetical protein